MYLEGWIIFGQIHNYCEEVWLTKFDHVQGLNGGVGGISNIVIESSKAAAF